MRSRSCDDRRPTGAGVQLGSTETITTRIAPRRGSRGRCDGFRMPTDPDSSEVKALRTLPGATIMRNLHLVQRDSVAVGIVNASTPYLPVLLLRLGGTALEVSLLTALPAIGGLLLAVPLGRVLQGRRNLVPWYSGARLLTQLALVLMGLAVLLLPSGGANTAAVVAVLAIWAMQVVPSTVVDVTFPVVMDGAMGSSRRLDLVGHRWSIMGITSAITVALAGQGLGILPFPNNYGLLFLAIALPAMASWWNSHQIRLFDQLPPAVRPSGVRLRLAAFAAAVRAEPRFLAFEMCSFLFAGSVRMAMPLLPLYYVREVHASDAWIGLIAAAAAAAQLLGYWGWRRIYRRHGTRPALLASILGSALIPAALTLTGSLPLLAALAAVASVFAAGANLVLFEELMQRVPSSRAVTFTSIDQSGQYLAASIAPIAGGLVAVVFGIRAALVVASSLGVVAFVLFSLESRGILRLRRAQ